MYDPAALASFASVAETLSFTESAQYLGLAQSTVSGHVLKLERVCGKRLLTRDTHSVVLTADGEAMLGFARSILDAHRRAARHFATDDLEGRIRLGISEDIALSRLPYVLREFVKSHPKIELNLTVAVSETLHGQLADGKQDIVLIKRLLSDSQGTPVQRDRLVWISAPSFELDRTAPIPLVVLAPPSLTRKVALAALEREQQEWRIVCSSDSQSGVHAAVAAGLGVAPHAAGLIPAGLITTGTMRKTGNLLPDLGKIEFVTLTRREPLDGTMKALISVLAGRKVITNTPAVAPIRA